MRSLLTTALIVLLGTPLLAQADSSDEITLDVNGIELGQAVQMIIRNRQVSLVTGEDLKQSVTAKFTAVPWRDALSSLLKSHGFTVVEEQQVLRIVKIIPESGGTKTRVPLVLRFKHISASAARDLLSPMVSAEGKLVPIDDDSGGHALSIVDTPEVLELIKTLLPDIDVPPSDSTCVLTRHDDGTVSFDLEGLPMRDLSEQCQEQLDINLFFHCPTKGSLNAKLNHIKLVDGLRLILQEKGLDFREENGVYVVDEAEKLTAQFVTREFKLKYLDAWDVKAYIEPLLSEGGKISCYSPRPRGGFEFGSKITDVRESVTADSGDGALRSKVFTVTAHPADVERIGSRIAELDVLPRSVEVNVKIVQITRNKSEKRGIDWNAVLSMSGSLRPTHLPFGPHSGRFFPGPVPNPTDANFIFGTLDATQLTAALQLIAQTTEAEVISEPNITTLDSIEASILIGQKFPVTTETIDPQTAVRTVTLDYYEDIGIQLNVIPSVSGPENRIHLIIHPAVSAVAELIENRYPVIQTREADTQVMLRSGETVVIGGLIESDVTEVVRRIPWISRIPLIGHLFTFNDERDVTTELILLVTPRIVRNASELEEALILDSQRVNELRDFDRVLETARRR